MHARVELTKYVAAILDFNVVAYFSIPMYYTSRVTRNIPYFTILV
jgi:hypothetical protein